LQVTGKVKLRLRNLLGQRVEKQIEIGLPGMDVRLYTEPRIPGRPYQAFIAKLPKPVEFLR